MPPKRVSATVKGSAPKQQGSKGKKGRSKRLQRLVEKQMAIRVGPQSPLIPGKIKP